MMKPDIKNVVFDVGNVLVRWNPVEIIRLTFGDDVDATELVKRVFQQELWLALNRGELTEQDAKHQYVQTLSLSPSEVERLFYYIKQTQIPLFGTVALMKRLKTAGYATYALTDNVHEIVAFLKDEYDFWPLFEGAIVSAEVGCLKPNADIFHQLFDTFDLNATETVFLDDVAKNVEGAQKVGMSAIQFTQASQAERELQEMGLRF
ncbi:HAD family hydrolase [Enterovibrio norvegicus]|uniref:HAD family hydrolase n=1 Tax=Enterovibrio norvegicus TaxID=188144 RepID=A0A2N7L4N1_9GAMM|nr:HAD family phosphatase [Enterovibrio norvegicus]PMN88340.1 HAD family hydrolase [Enterovibrio norvegicus]